MSVGFLAIFLLRNKPSDVKLTDYGGGCKSSSDQNDDEQIFNRYQQTWLMFKYPYFISLCLCYFTIQLVKTLFSDWSQLYLIKAIKIDNYTGKPIIERERSSDFCSFLASNFITSFEIAGLLSSIFSGFTTDYFMAKKKLKKNSNSRMPVLLFYMLLLLVSMFLFVYYITTGVSSVFVIFIGALAGFSTYGPITLLGVMAMEFTPKNLSGTSHGIVSLAANFGAICAGLPFSLLSKYYSWKFSFSVMQFFILFSFIVLFKFRNFDSNFKIEYSSKKEK